MSAPVPSPIELYSLWSLARSKHPDDPAAQNQSFMAALSCFAGLVAAAEREACAVVCDGEASRAMFSWSSDIPSNRGFWKGAEQIASGCADAIRARGAA